MNERVEGGGGASRSTEPAYGSSTGTDVSLREYFNARIEALDRHLTGEIQNLRGEMLTSNRQGERAVEVAAHEATERLEAHNNLIDQMREQASHFATRESVEQRRKELDNRIEVMRDTSRHALADHIDIADKRFSKIERFQYTLTGGIILLGAIGIANLVKVWTG